MTCETGMVYYGATSHSIKHRREKGHYHCTCADFINPKMEVVEKCNSIDEMYKREKYYIQNFTCVNRNGSIKCIKEYGRLRHQKWRSENPEKEAERNKRGLEKIDCDKCGKPTSKKHIKRHQRSHLCA